LYSSPSRLSTPPPPEVDWATAAHAMSSLLIPSDRQTRSHRPEDLAEVKVKKERPTAPVLSSVPVDATGRQLRGRKAAPSYAKRDSDDEKAFMRAESRASRRQTIADFATSAEPPAPSRSVSRRMSIASSVSSVGSRAPSVAASRRSVAPSTASANGVSMKKARGTAAARAPERPPVPRIPSGYSIRSSAPKGKENTDLDALTSGMGRVTLRVPTSEEHNAREKTPDEKLAMKEKQKVEAAPKKRLALKMPSKEEHDARRAAEAAPKKTTSKYPRFPPGTTMS
jgi:histone deacetylase HOS3